MADALQQARQFFRSKGGLLRTGEALAGGIHPRTLYALRERGEIDAVARGLFRLAGLPPLAEPDLVAVARRIPNAVICLISALAIHELTTQIPHAVHIAVKRNAGRPVLSHPPIRIYRFGERSFRAGVEHREIDGAILKVYSPEKTLADCFQYRDRIGLDVVIEAIRTYRRRRKRDVEKVLEYARVCRVERQMRPYLEAVL